MDNTVIVREMLQGYSRALYSNWLWHRPLQMIVDAGEGLHLTLGTNVFAPTIVAITHGHSDHVLGLAGFAGARRFGKGATSKPWTVLYPSGAAGVDATRAQIAGLWRGVAFPMTWVPMTVGQRHEHSRLRVVEAMPAVHVPTEASIGYRVLERRTRLRPEFAALPQSEVEELARRHGRDTLTEPFEHVVFAHSGDAMPIDPALVRDADLLVHDATFLGSVERRDPFHATTEEALQVAKAANVRILVMNHLSVRYQRPSAHATLRDQVTASGFAGACWLLDEHDFIDVSSPLSL